MKRLGEAAAGKTSLKKKYINNSYNEDEMATTSSSFVSKKIKYKEKEYIFNLWDTIGSEILRALNKIILTEVKIIVLVYDITYKSSFLSMQYC